jgi:hypothetical protein
MLDTRFVRRSSFSSVIWKRCINLFSKSSNIIYKHRKKDVISGHTHPLSSLNLYITFISTLYNGYFCGCSFFAEFAESINPQKLQSHNIYTCVYVYYTFQDQITKKPKPQKTPVHDTFILIVKTINCFPTANQD